MMTPGIYPDLPMAEYLSMPAVSASLLNTAITRCPKAAWHDSWMNTERQPEDPNKAMDAGTIAHKILLEGSEDGIEVIDPLDHPAEKTGAIPIGWTNKSIKAARDYAREQGKIPILLDSILEIRDMVAAAQKFIASLEEYEPAIWEAFQYEGGVSEMTIVWDDGPTRCRIRPDRISTDMKLIIDYKTGGTSAEPDTWGRRQMIAMSYYTSAAFYQRGVRAIANETPAYVWLVQEQKAPFLCSLVGLIPQAAALGAAKIESALMLWGTCTQLGQWPAYPKRVCYPELPAWEENQWREKEEEQLGNEYAIDKLWEKPQP